MSAPDARDVAMGVVRSGDVIGSIVVVLSGEGGLDVAYIGEDGESAAPIKDLLDVIQGHCEGKFKRLPDDEHEDEVEETSSSN